MLSFDLGVQILPCVSTPGGEADCVCQPRGGGRITSLQWLVNETLVETLQLNDATTTFQFGIGRLTFRNIPLCYNGTKITCTCAAIVNSVNVTQHSTLYLQGIYILPLKKHTC